MTRAPPVAACSREPPCFSPTALGSHCSRPGPCARACPPSCAPRIRILARRPDARFPSTCLLRALSCRIPDTRQSIGGTTCRCNRTGFQVRWQSGIVKNRGPSGGRRRTAGLGRHPPEKEGQKIKHIQIRFIHTQRTSGSTRVRRCARYTMPQPRRHFTRHRKGSSQWDSPERKMNNNSIRNHSCG